MTPSLPQAAKGGTTGPCSDCGAPISRGSRTGICRACYFAAQARQRAANARTCEACGIKIHFNSRALCQPCYRARQGEPVPADFAERAAEMNGVRLQVHYGRSNSTIDRWCRIAGIKPAAFRPDKLRPVPEGFVERAAGLTIGAARREWHAEHGTVKRWYTETGIKPAVYDNRAPKPGHNRPGCYHKLSLAAKRKVAGHSGPKSAFTMKLPRDSSLEGQAADHLRRTGPVYRCNERGRADQKGKFWRYGIGEPMTRDELIERAERRGFDPQAWARIGEAISGHEVDLARQSKGVAVSPHGRSAGLRPEPASPSRPCRAAAANARGGE